MQIAEDDGKVHAIAYVSRKLKDSERSYSVRELEALAIIWSIVKLREYLIGAPFTVVTDHSSLRWMMEGENLKTRLDRWAQQVREFAFRVVYRKGEKNVIADCMSRAPAIDRLELVRRTILSLKSREENGLAETKRERIGCFAVIPCMTGTPEVVVHENKERLTGRQIPSREERGSPSP